MFTINYASNRQAIIDYLEEIFPQNINLFLFVPKQCKGKYTSKRTKIIESSVTKYFCFFELRRFCKQEKIDRLFALGVLPQEAFLMTMASIFTNTDLICHLVQSSFEGFKIHRVGFTKSSIKAFFEFLFLFPIIFFSKKFYIGAKDLTGIAKRFFFFQKKKIEFLGLRIDTRLFFPKKKIEIRKKLNLPINKKITITVGRIEYQKGSDILFKLAQKNPDILFLLVGQLNDKRFLNENLNNIKIIPFLEHKELTKYYNGADLGLFTTRIDAGPLAARECLSCGVPVLISDINGPRNFIPAIKSKVNVEEFDKHLKNFFNLLEKERKILSKKSRDFIVSEGSEEDYKKEYIKKLVEF